MKNIAIIGHSLATRSFIETLREKNFSASLTVFAGPNDAPCPRHLLAEGLARQVVPLSLIAAGESWFKDHDVRLCPDKITRISFHRRWVAVEDKSREQVPFDQIVLADTGQDRFPDVKGTGRQGNFSLHRLSDLRAALDALPFFDTVVVRGGGFQALKTAWALRQREKEVLWVLPPDTMLAAAGVCPEPGMLGWAGDQGIRIISDQDIAEVLGEKEVKAVRLASGKVMAAQAVFWLGRGLPGEMDLRLFKDSDLLRNDTWTVHDDGTTPLTDVFVVDRLAVDPVSAGRTDDLAADISREAVLAEQGRALAARVMGQEVPAVPRRVARYGLAAADIQWDGVGRFYGEEQRMVTPTDADRSGRQVWLTDNRVQGALLCNAGALVEQLGALILNGAVLDGPRTDELGQVVPSMIQASPLDRPDAPAAGQPDALAVGTGTPVSLVTAETGGPQISAA